MAEVNAGNQKLAEEVQSFYLRLSFENADLRERADRLYKELEAMRVEQAIAISAISDLLSCFFEQSYGKPTVSVRQVSEGFTDRLTQGYTKLVTDGEGIEVTCNLYFALLSAAKLHRWKLLSEQEGGVE
jgi:hypothetical protein